jgi:hypothetical protein
VKTWELTAREPLSHSTIERTAVTIRSSTPGANGAAHP